MIAFKPRFAHSALYQFMVVRRITKVSISRQRDEHEQVGSPLNQTALF